MFIALLSFSERLACFAKISDPKKYLSLNDKPWVIKPSLIDLNPVELKYYPFIFNVDKGSGRCNVSSPKICLPNEKNTRKC